MGLWDDGGISRGVICAWPHGGWQEGLKDESRVGRRGDCGVALVFHGRMVTWRIQKLHGGSKNCMAAWQAPARSHLHSACSSVCLGLYAVADPCPAQVQCKLLAACILCFCFMIVEIVGGYMARR